MGILVVIGDSVEVGDGDSRDWDPLHPATMKRIAGNRQMITEQNFIDVIRTYPPETEFVKDLAEFPEQCWSDEKTGNLGYSILR